MDKKIVRTFELCTERLETLEDVIKILKALKIKINTDNPLFEELEYYFSTEVVPKGYLKVLDAVGYKEINKMTNEEIAQKAHELSQEESNPID